MIPQTGTILCVESDEALRKSRCEVLGTAGYTAVSATPQTAPMILSDRTFDLIVTSGLSEAELGQIYERSNGAEVLSLNESALPTLLLFLVDEQLRQFRQDGRKAGLPGESRGRVPDRS